MNRPKENLAEKRVEVLLEVGSEEIPAGMLPKAEEDLRANLEKLLTAENLSDGVTVETFSAPRRLVAHVGGLLEKQSDVVNEVTGPPKSVAYDSIGEPTRAAHSFADKQGLVLRDLYVVKTPKGEYLAAKQTKRGRSAEQILNEILPRVIHDLAWPRSMTWTGLDGARFIRPIRWIVAVVNGKPLKFSFAGVTAGDTTRGHWFLGKGPSRSRTSADYERNSERTRNRSPAERREKISKELAAHAKRAGYRIHEDAELLKLVTYLNECPGSRGRLRSGVSRAAG
jgi:glycyl-tRNA synthetase beta chain